MNSWEREVVQSLLDSETDVIDELEKQYKASLNEIDKAVRQYNADISVLDVMLGRDDLTEADRIVLESRRQSKVYQRRFQEALKGQINGIVERLHGEQYRTIEEYLNECYTNSFVGTMYDIAKQGIPLIVPINQAAVVRAVLTDSKIKRDLYAALGVDADALKKTIAAEVSRGIAAGKTTKEIARNIRNRANIPLSRAKTIARTEGHRIQQAATHDAQKAAKEKGCEVVKQWDSTMDRKTRPTHQRLDGQIREVEEPFEVNGKTAMYPGEFGKPEEDINCRCFSLTRATWALDEEELQTLQERAAFFGLDKTEDLEDFKRRYNIAAEEVAKQQDITEGGKYTYLTTKDQNEYADIIENEFTTQAVSVREVNQLWQADGGYIQNSQGYSDINSYMRGLKPRLDNPKCHLTMHVMQRITRNNALQRDYIGIRKVDSSFLENVMGIDVSGLFRYGRQRNAFGATRGAFVPRDRASAETVAARIRNIIGTPAATITDKGFTSVSLSEGLNYFTHYPIEFKIQMPQGTRGLITNNLAESEFIAQNGSSIEIFDAQVFNDGNKECIIISAIMKQQ